MTSPLLLGSPSHARVFRRYLRGGETVVSRRGALYLRTGDPRRVGGHGQEHLPLRRVHHDKRGRAYTHRLAHILIGEDVLVAVGDNGNTPL